MATETDIPESVCFKKGEREDDVLPSEILEEKVKLPEVRPNQPLETSSHVADIVNTQLETGKATNEGGTFFQALSVPKVTTDEKSSKPESCEPTTTEDQDERQMSKTEDFTEQKPNDDESNIEDHNVVETLPVQIEGSDVHARSLIQDSEKDFDVKETCKKDESMESSRTNTEAVNEEDLKGTNYVSESKEPEVKTKEHEEEDIEETKPGTELVEKTNYDGLKDGDTTDVCVSKQTEPEDKLSVPTDEESSKPEICEPTTTEDQEERQMTKIEALTEQAPKYDESIQIVASEEAFANDYEPNTEDHNVVDTIPAQIEGSYKEIEVKEICNKDESMKSSKTNTEAVNEENVQGKNYISETKESEFVKTKEHAEEDIKETRPAVEETTNYHGLQDAATTDVCVSKETEPEDKLSFPTDEESNKPESCEPTTTEDQEERQMAKIEALTEWAPNDDESIQVVESEEAFADDYKPTTEDHNVADAVSAQTEGANVHALGLIKDSNKDIEVNENFKKDESMESTKLNIEAVNEENLEGTSYISESKEPKVVKTEEHAEEDIEETRPGVEMEEKTNYHGLQDDDTTDVCVSKETEPEDKLSVPTDEDSNKPESCEPTRTEDQEECQTTKTEAFTEQKPNDEEGVQVVASEEAVANDYEPNTEDHNVVEAGSAQTEESHVHARGLTQDSYKDIEEENLQGTNYISECKEPEFVKTKEGVEEDIEETRPVVEMEDTVNFHGLQDAATTTTDVRVSKETEPEDKITENEEKANENHDGQTKESERSLVKEACEEIDSEKPETEEGLAVSDSIAPIMKEIVSKDENQQTEQAFKMTEKIQGDENDVTSSQDATYADFNETAGQHAAQHLNESPREVLKEETEAESNHSQKASEKGENEAKDKGEQKLKEDISGSEIEQEKETEEISRSVEIDKNLEQKELLHPSTTESHAAIVEHEEKDEEDATESEERGKEKVEYDKEVRISEQGEDEVTNSNKEDDKEKEQEVNISENEQGEDEVTSSLDVAFVEGLQEKNQASNEPEAVKTKESTEEDDGEIRLSVEAPEKIEQQRLIDVIPTDVCISTHIKPEEETTESKVKNDEEAIESDDGQTKMSGSHMVKEVCVEAVSDKPESEEGMKLSEDGIERKDEDQEKEKEQLYVAEKGKGDRDDVTSSQNVSSKHIEGLTSQDATTVACFEEAHDLNTIPKDILKEEAKDTTIDSQMESEKHKNGAKDVNEKKSEESVNKSVLSCSEIEQKEDAEEIKPSVETVEKTEDQRLLHAIMTDTCITAQAESQEESAAHEEKNGEEAIQSDDGRKEESDNPLDREICEKLGSEKPSDISSVKQDEKEIAILSKVEDQGNEHEPQGEEDASISTQTENQIGTSKHEEEAIESNIGQTESSDSLSVKEVYEETGSEKVEYEEEPRHFDGSSLKLNEKRVAILSEESDHKVNTLEKDQGDDDVRDSQDEMFEGGLQENNQHSESNEPEVLNTKESTKEETEEIKSSVETTEETEQQTSKHDIPTDVCISTETRPEEGTTQNKGKNDEGAVESDDGYTKKSEIPMVKEVFEESASEEAGCKEQLKLSDSSNIALNEDEIASNVTTVAYFEEAKSLCSMPEEIKEEEEDKSNDPQEAREQNENGANDKREEKPEESVNKIVHSTSKLDQEEYTEDIKTCVEKDEKKPHGFDPITTDAFISTETDPFMTTGHDEGHEEFIEDSIQKKNSEDLLIKEVCEETHSEKVESEGVELPDDSNIMLNEKKIEILSKDESQEKEQESNMTEQKQRENSVASSQDAIVASIQNLQATIYEGEGKEPEDDARIESIEEDTEEMRSCVERKEEVKHQALLHADEGDENKFVETIESIKEDKEILRTSDKIEERMEQEELHQVITTDVCISAGTESQEAMENEVKNEESTESGDGQKDKFVIPSVKEVLNDISAEKVGSEEGLKPSDSSNINLNKKAIETFKVNMSAKGQEKDCATSSEDAILEEDLQEKKYHDEGKELGFIDTTESKEKDTEIKSRVETKDTLEKQGLLHVITTDVCTSTQTDPKEETTENEEKNDVEAIENDDGRTNKSESLLVEEECEMTGSEKAESEGLTTLNENEPVSKKMSQEKEQELKMSEVQSDGEDVISMQNASSEDIKETTIGQHGITVANFQEGQGLSPINEIIKEEAEDKSINGQEEREQSEIEVTDKGELKSMESINKLVHQYSEIIEENIKEDEADAGSKKEEVYYEKSNYEAGEVGDETECKTAGETQDMLPENKDDATANVNKKVDEEQTHEQRSIDSREQENASVELKEQVEKEPQETTLYMEDVGSENPCTITQEIKNARGAQQDFQESQSKTNEEVEVMLDTKNEDDITEYRSEIKDEDILTEKISSEHGQHKEQNVQDIQTCLTKTISEKPEDEITRKDDDLSHDSIEDTNGNTTKDEKCFLDGKTREIEISTLEHKPVEEEEGGQDEVSKEQSTDLNETTVVEPQEEIKCFSSLGTSTEGNPYLEKGKAESENFQVEDLEPVSKVQIHEVVPKSEDSSTKEECLISSTVTCVGEEKGTLVKEISSDEKPEQMTEIKNEHPSIVSPDAILIEEEGRSSEKECTIVDEAIGKSKPQETKEEYVKKTLESDEMKSNDSNREAEAFEQPEKSHIMTEENVPQLEQIGENNSLCDHMEEDVTQKDQIISTEDHHEMVKDVILTEEIKQVPLEIQEKRRNDFKEQNSDEDNYPTELQKTTQYQMELAHEISYSEPIPVQTPEVKESREDVAVGQNLQATEDISCELKESSNISTLKRDMEEIFPTLEDDATLKPQLILSDQESSACPSESEKSPIQALESISHVQTPDVVVNSKDPEVKEDCIVIKTTVHADENNVEEEGKIKNNEPSSAEQNEQTMENKQVAEPSTILCCDELLVTEELGRSCEHDKTKEEENDKQALMSDINTKEKALTTEAAGRTKEEQRINEVQGQESEEDNYPIEVQNTSTSDQKDLANEAEYSKLLSVENTEVTEAKAESHIEPENIQTAEDLSSLSKASSTTVASKLEMDEGSGQTVTVSEVKGDSIDETSKDETIAVLENAKTLELQVNLPEVESTDAPSNGQETIEEKGILDPQLTETEMLEGSTENRKEAPNLEFEQKEIDDKQKSEIQTPEAFLKTEMNGENLEATNETCVTLMSELSNEKLLNELKESDVKEDIEEIVTQEKVAEDSYKDAGAEVAVHEHLSQTEEKSEVLTSPTAEGQTNEIVEETAKTKVEQCSISNKDLNPEFMKEEFTKTFSEDHRSIKERYVKEEGKGDLGVENKEAKSENEVLEIETNKKSTSINDNINEKSSCTHNQLISASDEVCQIKSVILSPNELLETKDSIEDTTDPKLIAENLNLKAETFIDMQGTNEDMKQKVEHNPEINASVFERLENVVTEEDIIASDANMKKETLKEPQADDPTQATSDLVSSSKEQDIGVKSEESRDQGDMPKLGEEATEVFEIIPEVAEIVPEDREVSDILAENVQEASLEVLQEKHDPEVTTTSEKIEDKIKKEDEPLANMYLSTSTQEVACLSNEETEELQVFKLKSEIDEGEQNGPGDVLNKEIEAEPPQEHIHSTKSVDMPSDVEIRKQGESVYHGSQEASEDNTLLSQNDKKDEDSLILLSVDKEITQSVDKRFKEPPVINVQNLEKSLEDTATERVVDVVSNAECSEFEQLHPDTKEANFETIDQENQNEEKKEAEENAMSEIPMKQVPKQTIMDKEIVHLESTCDKSKTTEEISATKQEPLELDSTVTHSTISTKDFEISKSYATDDLIQTNEVPASSVDKKSPNKPHENESIESKLLIGTIETSHEQGEQTEKSLNAEEDILKATKVSGTEPQCSGEVSKEDKTTSDEKQKSEPAEILFTGMLHESMEGNSVVAENLTEERENAPTKDHQVDKEETGHDGVKTGEENEEEEDDEDDQKMGSCSDAPVMVEASKDMDVKAHKKSHNILSGVGSKVKHSIAKVKKAITGKSSHPKPPSSKERD